MPSLQLSKGVKPLFSEICDISRFLGEIPQIWICTNRCSCILALACKQTLSLSSFQPALSPLVDVTQRNGSIFSSWRCKTISLHYPGLRPPSSSALSIQKQFSSTSTSRTSFRKGLAETNSSKMRILVSVTSRILCSFKMPRTLNKCLFRLSENGPKDQGWSP